MHPSCRIQSLRCLLLSGPENFEVLVGHIDSGRCPPHIQNCEDTTCVCHLVKSVDLVFTLLQVVVMFLQPRKLLLSNGNCIPSLLEQFFWQPTKKKGACKHQKNVPYKKCAKVPAKSKPSHPHPALQMLKMMMLDQPLLCLMLPLWKLHGFHQEIQKSSTLGLFLTSYKAKAQIWWKGEQSTSHSPGPEKFHQPFEGYQKQFSAKIQLFPKMPSSWDL